MIRVIGRIVLGLGLGLGMGLGAYATTIAAPGFAFGHARGAGGIIFHAPSPLPPEAEVIAQRISDQLDRSVLGRGDSDLSLFVTMGGWRDNVFFGYVPQAGGVVYVPLSARHGFLSGADFAANRLTKDGRAIAAPRTLVYYGVHELAHIRTYELTGVVGFHALPTWVQEGLADYVALGAPDAAGWDFAVSDAPVTIAQMRRLGAAYPRKRALVAWVLDHAGWSLDDLLATRLTQAQALDRMRADIAVARLDDGA